MKTFWIFGSCNCCESDHLRLWSLRLRLVGSLKSKASFAKEPRKTDDILQKETCDFTGLGGDLLRDLLNYRSLFAEYRLFYGALWQKRPVIFQVSEEISFACGTKAKLLVTHVRVCYDALQYIYIQYICGKRYCHIQNRTYIFEYPITYILIYVLNIKSQKCCNVFRIYNTNLYPLHIIYILKVQYVKYLDRIFSMTHSNMCHVLKMVHKYSDSFSSPWSIHMRATTHSNV